MNSADAILAMREAIQKVATGPEYSKDLNQAQAHAAMRYILSEDADPVQAAVFFIALRMKRETDDENKGVLQAIQESCQVFQVDVDELIDVADPYDGHSRGHGIKNRKLDFNTRKYISITCILLFKNEKPYG